MDRLTLVEQAARLLDLPGVGGRDGAKTPLPRRRLERPRAAEAQHGGAGLEGDRVAVDRGIGHSHVRAGGSVEALTVQREARAAGVDEVELLVGELGTLVVWLD